MRVAVRFGLVRSMRIMSASYGRSVEAVERFMRVACPKGWDEMVWAINLAKSLWLWYARPLRCGVDGLLERINHLSREVCVHR